LSCPGSGTGSERFGAGSTTSGNQEVAIGNGATVTYGGNGYDVGVGYAVNVTGQLNVVAGDSASSSGSSNIVLGASASSSGSDSLVLGTSSSNVGNDNVILGWDASSTSSATQDVILGYSATASGQLSTALGSSTSANNNYSIALGEGSTTTAADQLVIGSSAYIQNAYIGNGVTNTSPIGFTLQGTGGSGSNVAGASVAFAGGQGTGTGNGGSINLQIAKPGTSGSSLNSLATVESLSGANGAALFQTRLTQLPLSKSRMLHQLMP